MKKLIVVALLCTLLNANAENNKTDSLKQLLLQEQKDTSRVLLLLRVSNAYLYSKPDTISLLAMQGLSLAQKNKFEKGEALSLSYQKTLEIVFVVAIIFFLFTNLVHDSKVKTCEIIKPFYPLQNLKWIYKTEMLFLISFL